jgi:hypothetical protein
MLARLCRDRFFRSVAPAMNELPYARQNEWAIAAIHDSGFAQALHDVAHRNSLDEVHVTNDAQDALLIAVYDQAGPISRQSPPVRGFAVQNVWSRSQGSYAPHFDAKLRG